MSRRAPFTKIGGFWEDLRLSPSIESWSHAAYRLSGWIVGGLLFLNFGAILALNNGPEEFAAAIPSPVGLFGFFGYFVFGIALGWFVIDGVRRAMVDVLNLHHLQRTLTVIGLAFQCLVVFVLLWVLVPFLFGG